MEHVAGCQLRLSLLIKLVKGLDCRFNLIRFHQIPDIPLAHMPHGWNVPNASAIREAVGRRVPVIAVSLMCANDNSSLCEYTGDSFRDLTRIARINDKMWAELFLWNKQNLISEIDQFDAALLEMRSALVADDRDKLEQMFRLSTQRRAAFDKKLPE